MGPSRQEQEGASLCPAHPRAQRRWPTVATPTRGRRPLQRLRLRPEPAMPAELVPGPGSFACLFKFSVCFDT